MPALFERTITPSDDDKRIASETSQILEPLVSLSHEVQVKIVGDDASHQVLSIPAPALRLLNEILVEMAKGNLVKLVPMNDLLTTQEVADILNVSRPFLIGLLDAGKIPYQRLRSHRRILRKDLMAFKDKMDADREDAFRRLTEEAQELNMGY